MSIAASNVGMASAQELGCIAAGSLVLTFTVSQTFNITTEHVSGLAWKKVDSLYLSDEFLKSQAYAVIYAMMSARVLGLTDVLPETPSTQLTDEEISEQIENTSEAVVDLLLQLDRETQKKIVTITVGVNRQTGMVAVGIKCNFASYTTFFKTI